MENIKNKLKKALENRGFYIILFACVTIVSASVIIRNMSDSVIKKMNTDLSEQSVSKTLDEPPLPQIQNVSTALEITDEQQAEAQEPIPSKEPPSQSITSLQIPADGNISKKFSGERLVYSQTFADWRVHKGVDIDGAISSQVKAAADGVVEKVYNDDSLGVVVIIGHVGGLKTLYANLQSTEFISVGKKVSAGDIIGGIGNTAVGECVEASHLHFETILNGKNVDPAPFFPARL